VTDVAENVKPDNFFLIFMLYNIFT